VLAFAVRHEHAAYGLMVTASHNPRQDNGIKLYVRDGGQLLPPDDEAIAASIDAVDPLHLPAGWAEGPFEFTPADEAVQAYVRNVAARDRRAPDAPALKVVHTALHGVGDATLRAVLATAGWPAPVAVTEQQQPDPGFPTVPYPNPEAPGVRCVTTLTGFKWIARAAGPDAELAYGYEQALGYAVRPDLVADKDGISAALLLLRCAAELAKEGRTLTDRLDDLALAHGVHVTRERSLRAAGPTGLARLAGAVARVRQEPPRLLDGQPVTVTDLRMGTGGLADLAGGHAERAPGRPVPPADVLIWHAGAGARVMVRPSGTEPVLKLYAEAVRPVRSRAELPPARAAAIEQAERMLAAAATRLDPGTGEA
jgi:phosphomannomutase